MKRIALAIAAFAALFALTPAAAMAANPTATTGAASAVTPTTATIAGSVNLQGGSYSSLGNSCEVEYGTSTSYGSTVNCPTAPTSASTTATPETFALTGLTAGTTYHYNVLVSTGGLLGVGATDSTVSDMTFTTPNTTTPPTVATTTPTVINGTSATLTGTVNPENWGITSCTFVATASSGGTPQSGNCATTPTGSTATNVSAVVSNLASGTAYTYTLTVGYGSGTSATTVVSGTPGAFTTMAAAVATPVQLTDVGGTLVAAVYPEGQTLTDCEFYYGTSVSTLVKVPCSTTTGALASPTTVTAAVTGLTAGTTYIDTVLITAAGGGTAVAPIESFTTAAKAAAPTATLGAPTAVTASTATLHAVVDAQGQGVKGCEFLLGTSDLTTTLGQDQALTYACSTSVADSGSQNETVSLKGLAPGTKYYVRLLFTTYGGYIETTQSTFDTRTNVSVPLVKITGTTLNKKAKSVKFTFGKLGSVAITKGYQCALATVTKGKVGAIKYAKCSSPKTYTKLKATTYAFYVRGGNTVGYGKAVVHKFTL